MIDPQDQFILTLFSKEQTKEKAFKMLMDKYQKDAYLSVKRIIITNYDTDDIVQNVWIKIWRFLSSFKGDSSLKTWIVKICTNETLNFINKRKKTLELIDINDVEYELQNKQTDLGYISSDKIQTILQKAISALPDKQQMVFSLRYFEEMPYEEMSKILKISESALKSSYHFAVKKVEKYIKSLNF